MKHVEQKVSFHFELQIESIFSVSINYRNQNIFEEPLQHNNNSYIPLISGSQREASKYRVDEDIVRVEVVCPCDDPNNRVKVC